MIEKAVASAIEPIVDEILALEKRLDAIQLIPGEPGKDGKDAEPVEVDVDDVVKALIDSPDFMTDNHTYIAKQFADFEARQLEEVRNILFS